tara:strand:- start:1224 stop:1634 length:411 start_codon:yes stop_codon:yes gene_type:complete
MTIQPLDEVALYDLNTRSPLLFSTLTIAEMEQQTHPAHEFDRRISASEALNPLNLKLGDIPRDERSRRSGPASAERQTRARPRPTSFPLMGQDIPSTNSITLIAGLTERQIAPLRSVALYERTAQPALTLPTLAIG